MSSRFSFVT